MWFAASRACHAASSRTTAASRCLITSTEQAAAAAAAAAALGAPQVPFSSLSMRQGRVVVASNLTAV